VGCDVSIQQNPFLTFSASDCCLADDVNCIQHYSTIACDRSLENNATILSDDCYQAMEDDFSGCHFWEPKCNSYPGEACEETVVHCCDDVRCSCDFYKYASSSLDYENAENNKNYYCTLAASIPPNTREDEKLGLYDFYNETGGDDWFNNTGWLSDQTSHCEWYGVKCNEEGQVSAINLNANNLQGYVYGVSPRLELLLEL
jgi:hypothetical protein